MGNAGSSIGDIFYPDNPSRRDRASQLRDDCSSIQTGFDEQKSQVDALDAKVRGLLNDFLAHQGYKNIDELHTHVESILSGDALANWQSLKDELKSGSVIEDALLSVAGVATIMTGILAGGLFITGAVAGAAAFSIMGAGAGLAGILAIGAFVIAIVESGQERSDLQDSIHQLAFARVDLQMALDKARVLTGYLQGFEAFFTTPGLDNETVYSAAYGKYLNRDMSGANRAAAISELKDLDDRRNSWRDDDPDVTNPEPPRVGAANPNSEPPRVGATNPSDVASAQPFPKATLEVKSASKGSFVMHLEMVSQSSLTDCIAKDMSTHDSWAIHAKVRLHSKDKKQVFALKNVLFKLTQTVTGEVRDNCSIMLVTAAAGA